MPRHDPLIDTKLASKGWELLRPTFMSLHTSLLDASPHASAKAETVYVKYRIVDDVMAEVFAVIWIRTTRKLIAGIALPPSLSHPLLGPAPPRCYYPPLNRYLSFEPGQSIPQEFSMWARLAYEFVSTSAEGLKD